MDHDMSVKRENEGGARRSSIYAIFDHCRRDGGVSRWRPRCPSKGPKLGSSWIVRRRVGGCRGRLGRCQALWLGGVPATRIDRWTENVRPVWECLQFLRAKPSISSDDF